MGYTYLAILFLFASFTLGVVERRDQPLGPPKCKNVTYSDDGGRPQTTCSSTYGDCPNVVGYTEGFNSNTIVEVHPDKRLCLPSIACSQDCTDADLAPPWPRDGSVPTANCYSPEIYLSVNYQVCVSDFGFCNNDSFNGCLQRFGCVSDCGDLVPGNLAEDLGSFQPFLPWNWTVEWEGVPGAKTCPTPSRILGTFAAVNVATTVLSLIIGNEYVTSALCCHRKKEPTQRSIAWRWIVPVVLQLGANATIAVLIKHTPGYGDTFSVVTLTVFFAARPRLSWIVLVILGSRNESYQKTAIAQSVAEIVMQLIASYTIGITAHYGASHGWLVIGKLYGEGSQAAQLMYSGSLFYLVLGSAGTIWAVLWTISGIAGVNEAPASEWFRTLGVPPLSPLFFFNWLGSWLFWAGFVKVAGDLYCPPSLLTQAGIWTGFSALAAFFGGSF